MESSNTKRSISSYEHKRWSQHGEDGIINALTRSLKTWNHNFVEIGAAWEECNSRELIEAEWSGLVFDMRPRGGFPAEVYRQQKIQPGFCLEGEPDFFSLDIDSYDYFVADALLRGGFRPKVVCVETNTFIPGTQSVPYIPTHSRYALHPGYGLYFGCSLGAWKHLWGQYGYRYVGMESSYTNAFFVRADASDWPESTEPVGYQTYFCRKYAKSGEQLSASFVHPFVDVTSAAYEDAFRQALDPDIEAVCTFTPEGYEKHARRFIESWPFPLTCYTEQHIGLPHERVHENPFAERYRHIPFANGQTDTGYHYMLDAVKWSHRIYALADAARNSSAAVLINIDSDIYVFDPPSKQALLDLLGDADIAYLPRRSLGVYSECSFVMYRLSNPLVRAFIEDHQTYYDTNAVFALKAWTDCHIFDDLIAHYAVAIKVRNINEGVPPSMHPFVNGPLGRWMDHMKGARKNEGRSRPRDLVVQREEEYWQRESTTAAPAAVRYANYGS